MPVARSRAVVSAVLLVAAFAWTTPALASHGRAGDTVTAETVTADTGPSDTVASGTDTADTSPDATNGWRLENDPSECINSNPRPNCGYEPQDAGERGGWLQITLFFVLMAALGVIFTVIIRNVVRRDRATAERVARAGGQEPPANQP